MKLTLAVVSMVALQASAPDAAGRVWIEGTSNVADWSCRAERFDARLDSGRVSIRLASHDLKCGNRRMDRDLYAALKDSEIVARVDSSTNGTLSVAGIARSVQVTVATERQTDGSVRARGSVPLRMTDFGIRPPVGLFGLIRSRNDVVVRFDLVLRPGEWGS